MKKILAIIIILTAFAGIGWFYQKHHPEKEKVLVLYGNVDIREVNLGFRVGGRLSKLIYDEGDRIKPGEVIAQLDDEPYRNQVANVSAQVNSL